MSYSHFEDPDEVVERRRNACDDYLEHLEDIILSTVEQNNIVSLGSVRESKSVNVMNVIAAYEEARTGYARIGDERIKKLAASNPKFEDAIQKYKIVERLKANLDPVNPSDSAEKLEGFDDDFNDDQDNEFKLKNKAVIERLPDIHLNNFLREVNPEQELKKRADACVIYKAQLLITLNEIYNQAGGGALGDPLELKHPDKIAMVNGLRFADPEFDDAYQKYEVVHELQRIAESKEIKHAASSLVAMHKLQKIDECLDRNKHKLIKFPDNTLVVFLKAVGATSILSLVEAIRKKLFDSKGADFFSKVRSAEPAKPNVNAMHEKKSRVGRKK